MPQPIDRLTAGLPVTLVGRPDRLVAGAQTLAQAGPDDMSFVADKAKLAAATASAAGVLFIRPELSPMLPARDTCTLVVTDDPKGQLVTVLARLMPARRRSEIGISPHAYVHPKVSVGRGTNIYPGASVGSGTVIGSGCDILPGVHIGPGCQIGDQVQIHPNVVLYHDITIGDRVTIQAGSIIGADGFGYETKQGRHERIPHLGTVRIEADVDLGANTTIDRAVFGETVIGEGTKIDNLCVIAHNCRLGKHNLLVSQVGFAGTVTTGDYVVCAGQVGIADHVHIGSGAVLGAKAGVHRDMPGGKTYLGTPAAPIEETVRNVIAVQKLPAMRKTLKELEKQITALQSRLNAAPPQREAA